MPITQRTFRNIRDWLHKLHFDKSIPKELRRRILEASVRAPEEWHQNAIRAAYSSGDKEWILTAVQCEAIRSRDIRSGFSAWSISRFPLNRMQQFQTTILIFCEGT